MRLYEATVLDGVPDPDLPGHIKVMIPELYRDNEFPFLVPPLYPGPGKGGWQSIPEEGEQVALLDLGGSSFRWLGTLATFGAIAADPANRVGCVSKDGRHSIILDSVFGFQAAVQSDAGDEMSFVRMDPADDDITISAATGQIVTLARDDDLVNIQNAGGDTIQLSDDGILLMHRDGACSLNFRSGDVASFNGQVIQISANSIELGDGSIPPVNPFLLTLAFFADLSLVLADVIAIGAAIPAGLPYVATNTTTVAGKIATSLSAGAPYLSNRIFGD